MDVRISELLGAPVLGGNHLIAVLDVQGNILTGRVLYASGNQSVLTSALILVPAIDIRGGKVVRLKQGRVRDEEVYGSDPTEAARRWEEQSAGRVHLVDLDAAIEGRPQPDVVERVIAGVGIPVEVGGGLRSFDDALRGREAGAERVIFGTAAISNPEAVERAAREWPGAVCVALDARDGKVAVAGWQEITGVGALELALRVKALGVTRVQLTDVVRDGTLVGPNLAATEQLARDSGLRVTATGGRRSS